MGKSFKNTFKTFKHDVSHNPVTKFFNKKVEINPIGNLPLNPMANVSKMLPISDKHKKNLEDALNPVKAVETIVHSRGTEKGKAVGQILETVGSGVSLVGLATAQPELGVLGTALTMAGGYEKGEAPAEIIGEGIGSYLGGKALGATALGAEAGGLIGGNIGGKIGGDLAKEFEGMIDRRPGGRNHNDQLKEHIGENSHRIDGMEHHNSGVLPGDLKPDGHDKTSTGATAQQGHQATSQEAQELENEISFLNTTNDILSVLVENLPMILQLTTRDRNEVLDEVLDTGLVNELTQDVNSFSVPQQQPQSENEQEIQRMLNEIGDNPQDELTEQDLQDIIQMFPDMDFSEELREIQVGA
ncbi:MAG: hypothetical protein ACXADW_20500 [Candidatus Hodarchaeales archaeon]|jgi:hypothetical protein